MKSQKTDSYAKLIFELIKLSNLHKYKTKLIGYEKFEKIKCNYPIYRFIINPSSKKRFGIVTGLHGDEIAGPHTIYNLFKNPKKYFNKKICYHVYPVLSPTAFDLKRRYDDDNVELNTLNKRTIKNYKYHEIKYFHLDAKKIKFNAILSLHEDVEQTKFYAYVNQYNNEIYKKIMDNTSKHCEILKKKTIDKRASNQKGFIIGGHDQTIEDWLFRNNKLKFCMTTETPGKINLDTRIKINLNNIKQINEFILENK